MTKKCLYEYLLRGYWFGNYKKGELTIFYPSHEGGGSAGVIHGRIADKLGKIYDSWNYRIIHKLI